MQKIKASAALVVVFLLIFATNVIDNNRFEIVKKSLATVYDDRLMAKDYLYKIASQIQIKKNILYSDDIKRIIEYNKMSTDSIQSLVGKFATTKLTHNEANHFKLLKTELDRLHKLEIQLIQNPSFSKADPLFQKIRTQHLEITDELDKLSEIQLEEGKREIIYSTRAIETSNFISKIEIGFLIFIGLMLQLLIFYTPSKKKPKELIKAL